MGLGHDCVSLKYAVVLQLLTGYLLGSCYLLGSTSAHRDGDYIHTARKSQFHQQRTNWHDVLGHHCPRFGMDRLVRFPALAATGQSSGGWGA